jgi:hypothetical protein
VIRLGQKVSFLPLLYELFEMASKGLGFTAKSEQELTEISGFVNVYRQKKKAPETETSHSEDGQGLEEPR